MLKITYFGHTAFALESKETTVLLNPGFTNDEPVVPDDFDTRVVLVTNDNDDALGNATKIAENSKAWILGNKMTIDKVESQGGKPWLLHVLKSEEPYQIPGFKVTPYSLQRGDPQTDVFQIVSFFLFKLFVLYREVFRKCLF